MTCIWLTNEMDSSVLLSYNWWQQQQTKKILRKLHKCPIAALKTSFDVEHRIKRVLDFWPVIPPPQTLLRLKTSNNMVTWHHNYSLTLNIKVFIFTRYVFIHFVCTFYIDILGNKLIYNFPVCLPGANLWNCITQPLILC